MSELVLVDEDREVRKAQALVQSRYKLNPLPLKLITTLISSVQSNDTPEQEYCIRVKDFTDLQGLKGKDYYDKLDKATDEIMMKPIKVKLSSGKKDFLKANWASSIKYVEGEGIIKFKISEDIFPYILNLKENYLKYDLINILSLKSDYSIRIYEWLKDEFNKNARYGKSAELILEVDYIRERLEIPESYAYKDIRVQILEKAEKDLLANCDIKFTWEIASKIRKRVSHIKFKVFPNLKNIKDDVQLPPYLASFMKYVNYLKNLYKDSQKYFLAMTYDLGNGRQAFYFGINKDGFLFAMPVDGGTAVSMTKIQSETIYNASYLCSLHSDIYRDFISTKSDIWELSKDLENKEYWGVLKTEIVKVLKENDCRIKPMI